MMKKKIASKTQEILNPPTEVVPDPSFSEGVRFLYQDKEWIVVKSFKIDSQEHRQIVSRLGDDHIVSLDTLVKDSLESNFKFLPRDEMAEKVAKARQK